MKYIVNRISVSNTPDFIIRDAHGKDLYKLTNQAKVGSNYGLFDVAGKKCADIKQVISFSNKIRITSDSREITLTLSFPYRINGDPFIKFKGLDWSTQGNICHHVYSILDGSYEVARVRMTGALDPNMDLFSKMIATKHREMEIDCNDKYDEPLTFAVIIAIEIAADAEGSRTAN